MNQTSASASSLGQQIGYIHGVNELMGLLPFPSALSKAGPLFIILLFISSESIAKCRLLSLLEAHGKKNQI